MTRRDAAGRPSWPPVGERFGRTVAFTAADIADFATRCGDLNPLHHDAQAAARSRFGGIIACGPHTSAVFTAIIATHFSADYDMVGVDIAFRFDRAVPAGSAVTMTWTVAEVRPTGGGGRARVRLVGQATDGAGRRMLSGEANAVLWPKVEDAAAGDIAPGPASGYIGPTH